MSTNPNNTYEEWLTAIAGTRLLFNTMAELEDWLDNHSLHNNGVKRSFKSVQRMRAAFRDLKEQVRLDTDEAEDLEMLLGEYQTAWRFYEEHLSRRANPEDIAFQLLQFCYAPAPPKNLNPRIAQNVFASANRTHQHPFPRRLLAKSHPRIWFARWRCNRHGSKIRVGDAVAQTLYQQHARLYLTPRAG